MDLHVLRMYSTYSTVLPAQIVGRLILAKFPLLPAPKCGYPAINPRKMNGSRSLLFRTTAPNRPCSYQSQTGLKFLLALKLDTLLLGPI